MNGLGIARSTGHFTLCLFTVVFEIVQSQYYGRYVPCPKSYLDPDGDCLPGIGGKDYPMLSPGILSSIDFDCRKYPVKHVGYFADVQTKCQAFHVCFSDGRRDSFLCPDGTLFNQQYLVCDWWFNVRCLEAQKLYVINDYLEAPLNFRLGPISSKVSPIPVESSPLRAQSLATSVTERSKSGQSFLSTLLFGQEREAPPRVGSVASVPLTGSNDVNTGSSSWSVPVSASMSYQNPLPDGPNKQNDFMQSIGSMINAASLLSNLMSFANKPLAASNSNSKSSTHESSGGASNWLSSIIQPRSKPELQTVAKNIVNLKQDEQTTTTTNNEQKPPINYIKKTIAGSPR